MLKKIRYRLVWNRSGRLNSRGEGLVQIEMEQAGRRIYLSTHTYLKPGQWQGGLASASHPLHEGLNTALLTQLMEVERVELDYIRQGVYPSLMMVRDAVRDRMAPGARLTDFIREMMKTGERREHTRQGYMTLANSIDRWHRSLLLSDVDYQLISRYEQSLKDAGLAHNTIVGRLRQWRAVMNEAVRRRLLQQNPFRGISDRAHGGTAWLPDCTAGAPTGEHAADGTAGKGARLVPLLLLHGTAIQRPYNIAA